VLWFTLGDIPNNDSILAGAGNRDAIIDRERDVLDGTRVTLKRRSHGVLGEIPNDDCEFLRVCRGQQRRVG
jgi:hypothetical protein